MRKILQQGFLTLIILTHMINTHNYNYKQPNSTEKNTLQFQNDEKFPLDLLNITGLVCIAFMIFLATLAGIGGTAAFLSIILIFFRFPTRVAIAHASSFTLIGCLIRFIYEYIAGLKNSKRKNINFDIALVTAPGLFLGSFLGVIFNKTSPRVIILLVITLVLCLIIYKSAKKFVKERKKEKLREKGYKEDQGDVSDSGDGAELGNGGEGDYDSVQEEMPLSFESMLFFKCRIENFGAKFNQR